MLKPETFILPRFTREETLLLFLFGSNKIALRTNHVHLSLEMRYPYCNKTKSLPSLRAAVFGIVSFGPAAIESDGK